MALVADRLERAVAVVLADCVDPFGCSPVSCTAVPLDVPTDSVVDQAPRKLEFAPENGDDTDGKDYVGTLRV